MRTEDESHTGQGDVQISISSKWNRVLKGKGMCQKARLQRKTEDKGNVSTSSRGIDTPEKAKPRDTGPEQSKA